MFRLTDKITDRIITTLVTLTLASIVYGAITGNMVPMLILAGIFFVAFIVIETLE